VFNLCALIDYKILFVWLLLTEGGVCLLIVSLKKQKVDDYLNNYMVDKKMASKLKVVV
jgi:hypothetical protein